MNIRLQSPSTDYAQILHQWRNEPATLKYNPVQMKSLEELKEALMTSPISLQPLDKTVPHRWFISVDDDVVGTVSLSEINATMGTAEIGYMIGEAYFGRGIATAALKLWTAKIFEETDMRKLTASVAEENTASIRVLEKAGFKKEGVLREHYLIQNQPTNEVVFGLLRRDWLS